MSDERLSKNFVRSEFRCRGMFCCSESAPVNPALVVALQHLRDIVNRPLHVTSGFRCHTHNHRVGSQDDSQHPLGNAADIMVPDGYTVEQLAELAEHVPGFADGGIGRYLSRGFIHVDVRGDGPARWVEQ